MQVPMTLANEVTAIANNTYLTCRDQPRPTVTRRDPPWPVVPHRDLCCDVPWPAVTSDHRTWPVVTYSDRPWPTVTCHDLSWSTVTCCYLPLICRDLLWPDLQVQITELHRRRSDMLVIWVTSWPIQISWLTWTSRTVAYGCVGQAPPENDGGTWRIVPWLPDPEKWIADAAGGICP